MKPLKDRVFEKDDEIRAILANAKINVGEAVTILALLTIVHTVLAQGTLIGETVMEATGMLVKEKKEEVH